MFPGPPGTDGEYHVHYKQAENSPFKEFLDPDVCHSVALERLPYAHRAVKIAADPKGRNFALIQVCYPYCLSPAIHMYGMDLYIYDIGFNCFVDTSLSIPQ